ncbi:MAG: bacteriocin [Ferruginibacter sp.]
MKKLTADEMKKISGGKKDDGCVEDGICHFSNQCNNPPPGAVDWFCHPVSHVCIYCF